MNFIRVELCDNDFGWKMRDALVSAVEDYGYHETMCPNLMKKFVIMYTIHKSMENHMAFDTDLSIDWDYMKKLETYLSKMRVTYDDSLGVLPDHDGGSAYYDLNLNFATTF